MKQVLITGKSGYIASSFYSYLRGFPEEYEVEKISVRGDQWQQTDFSRFDVVIHCAGLAHIKETAENARLHYEINRDLTIAVAERAREAGVRQFIFLSSLSVYGMDEGIITPATKERPKNAYGISKYQAELSLKAMESDAFRVTILRPPMVYGMGCKGNYQILVKLAGILPLVPVYTNQRSAVSITCLCERIKQTMDTEASGIIVPQDVKYMCTCKEIQRLAFLCGHWIYTTKLFYFVPALLCRWTSLGRKAFGDLVYLE